MLKKYLAIAVFVIICMVMRTESYCHAIKDNDNATVDFNNTSNCRVLRRRICNKSIECDWKNHLVFNDYNKGTLIACGIAAFLIGITASGVAINNMCFGNGLVEDDYV